LLAAAVAVLEWVAPVLVVAVVLEVILVEQLQYPHHKQLELQLDLVVLLGLQEEQIKVMVEALTEQIHCLEHQ
tara:strand:- start:198 stop:416 length:219 start_codon:yes stop_codon:yes gene_type:complete